MSKYYAISRQEMETFLFPQGFTALTIPGTKELVYGKIVKKGNHTVSMRILSGINPDGVSRGCGQDAIRVALFIRYEGEICPVGKSQRVLRVKTWAKNLQKAIDQWSNNWQDCPACHYPMVLRQGKNGEFWGCVTYFKTKCNGRSL